MSGDICSGAKAQKGGEAMANNFFDLVKDEFFLPFTNQNKRINYDLLQLLNSKMSLENIQVEKEQMAEWIVDYLENCPVSFTNDETNEVEKDNRSLAFDKIHYFVRCGWLIEDYEGLRITYQLDENGIKILEALENAVKDDIKSLEFSGYVYNIYSSLYNFNLDHAVDIVEQVYNVSRELNSMLRGLNANIKKFLDKLIKEHEAAPKEILETLLYEYQKKVILKAFKNFREKDNPSRYKGRIQSKIDDLLSKNEERMVSNYIEVKCSGLSNEENLREASGFFSTRLLYIRDQFDVIEDAIASLDKKNTKYISTARARLNFLLNEETDVEGRITDCLKEIGKLNEDGPQDFDEFGLYSCSNIDEYSLFAPQSRKEKPKLKQVIESPVFDKEEIKRLTERLFKDSEYSVDKINRLVLSSLNEKSQIHTKDIETPEVECLFKVFLIHLYSQNPNVSYRIVKEDQPYRKFGYLMRDYIIERK